jgi:hypothetical protein
MKTLLTGSRVYGTPRQDSDLDMVVLIEDQNDYNLLYNMGGQHSTNQTRLHTDQLYNGVSMRFGNLNVIAILNDERTFKAWEAGTEFLKKIAPVTKETACMVFETMFAATKQPPAPKLPF